jgi:hypothetical protein
LVLVLSSASFPGRGPRHAPAGCNCNRALWRAAWSCSFRAASAVRHQRTPLLRNLAPPPLLAAVPHKHLGAALQEAASGTAAAGDHAHVAQRAGDGHQHAGHEDHRQQRPRAAAAVAPEALGQPE